MEGVHFLYLLHMCFPTLILQGVRWLEVHSKVHSKIIDLKSMLEIELSSGKTYSIRRMDKPNIGLFFFNKGYRTKGTDCLPTHCMIVGRNWTSVLFLVFCVPISDYTPINIIIVGILYAIPVSFL